MPLDALPRSETESLRRLRVLRRFFSELGDWQVNLDHWYRTGPVCGTIACLGGWACMILEFREMGLELRNAPETALPCPVFLHRRGHWALAEFFGIGISVARLLFATTIGCWVEAGDSHRAVALRRLDAFIPELEVAHAL